MVPMPIKFVPNDGSKVWPELEDEPVNIHVCGAIEVAVLDGGMESGKPSIMLRSDLPNGDVAISQTSARLFCGAARAIMEKYPNLMED